MPVCSYVVIARKGARDEVVEALSLMPGCDVVPAKNADVLLLVTESGSVEAEADLRSTVEGLPNIEALLMSFAEIDADACNEGAGGRPPAYG